ncbi:reverse transcriptase domain-containing protein [Tanacetum coccineum]
MSVRLANRSFQYPVGIVENMLAEVGKFTFPADFVILEMEEDSKVSLILGRPFSSHCRCSNSSQIEATQSRSKNNGSQRFLTSEEGSDPLRFMILRPEKVRFSLPGQIDPYLVVFFLSCSLIVALYLDAWIPRNYDVSL